MTRVEIHPYFAPFHASFFLEGLRLVFGAGHVTYSAHRFPPLKRSGFLKFVVRGETERRFFVDEWDTPSYEESGLAWCDVYAKRNIDPARMPSRYAEKVVPAGPTFPLRFAAPVPALYGGVKTWFLAKAAGTGYAGYAKSREHFLSWYRQWSYGVPLSSYEPGQSSADYVFFSSSIWKEDGETNQTRAHFIEACRSMMPGVNFEGGFTPRSAGPVGGYEHLTVDRRYTHQEFIDKTKRSAVAFNNPAVERAFSWRLGESLALGKAIISTPLERLVPAPLVHGEHLHLVEPTFQSMRDAIEQICGDDAYRMRLEQGARQYYIDYVSPQASVKRLLAAAESRA